MTEFKILDKKWTMQQVQPTDKSLFLDGGYCMGVCYYSEREIYVNKELNLEVKTETLLHELTHAFLDTLQLSKKEEYNEEEVCEFVGKYSHEIQRIANRLLKTEIYDGLDRLTLIKENFSQAKGI